MASTASVGRIVINLDAGTTQFILDMHKATAGLNEFGAANKHVVTDMQATSAMLRTVDGGFANNLRAAERFVASIKGVGPIVQALFPIAGGIALLGVFDMLYNHATKWYDAYAKLQDAPKRITQEFQKIIQPIQVANDELRVTNDRLANDIAKLEGRPQNGLALALDEARLSADRLADSLRKDLAEVAKLLKSEEIGAFKQFAFGKASTTNIKEFFSGKDGYGGFQEEIEKITAEASEKLANIKPGKDAAAQEKLLQAKERNDLEAKYRQLLTFSNTEISTREQITKSQRALLDKNPASPRNYVGSSAADNSAAINQAKQLRQIALSGLDSVALRFDNSDLAGRKAILSAIPKENKSDPFGDALSRLQTELTNAKTALKATDFAKPGEALTASMDKADNAIVQVTRDLQSTAAQKLGTANILDVSGLQKTIGTVQAALHGAGGEELGKSISHGMAMADTAIASVTKAIHEQSRTTPAGEYLTSLAGKLAAVKAQLTDVAKSPEDLAKGLKSADNAIVQIKRDLQSTAAQKLSTANVLDISGLQKSIGAAQVALRSAHGEDLGKAITSGMQMANVAIIAVNKALQQQGKSSPGAEYLTGMASKLSTFKTSLADVGKSPDALAQNFQSADKALLQIKTDLASTAAQKLGTANLLDVGGLQKTIGTVQSALHSAGGEEIGKSIVRGMGLANVAIASVNKAIQQQGRATPTGEYLASLAAKLVAVKAPLADIAGSSNVGLALAKGMQSADKAIAEVNRDLQSTTSKKLGTANILDVSGIQKTIGAVQTALHSSSGEDFGKSIARGMAVADTAIASVNKSIQGQGKTTPGGDYLTSLSSKLAALKASLSDIAGSSDVGRAMSKGMELADKAIAEVTKGLEKQHKELTLGGKLQITGLADQIALITAEGKAIEAQAKAEDKVSKDHDAMREKLDAENLKRQETLTIIADEINATRLLAAAEAQGSDAAVAAAQEQIKLTRLQDPDIKAGTKTLIEAEHSAAIAKTISQLNDQTDAIKRVDAAQNAGLDARRKAELANKLAPLQENLDFYNQNPDNDPSGTNRQQIQAQIDAEKANSAAKNQQEDDAVLRNSSAKDGYKKFYAEMKDNTNSAGQMVHDVLGTAFSGLDQQMTALISGQKANWSSFFSSLASQFANFGISKLLTSVLGMATGGVGGGIGGLFSSLFGHRAEGGSVDAGSAYVVGEKGPEVFVPPGSGSIVPNKALGGSSSGATYVIDARGTDAAQVERRVQTALVAVHGSAVRTSMSVMQEQQRRHP